MDAEHLTEDERQTMADGSLSGERATVLFEHLARCAACSGDVARLRTIRARVTSAPTGGDAADAEAMDALWPAIRARIDQRKDAALVAAGATTGAAGRRAGNRVRLVAGLAAAACIVAAALVGAQLFAHRAPRAPQVVAATNVSDSVAAYQQEAQTLLDELELRRAMLRPEALTAIEHDLAVVDSAIVELRAAAARDPNNAALHQLLASTYQRKIEILKRIGNAG
jgi:anti-sigma factor RsiW